MTKEQARWARQHDWCVAVHKQDDGGYMVSVESITINSDGTRVTELGNFEDFAKLRAWAGY